MDIVLWAICFPIFLASAALGIGIGYSLTDSGSTGFLIARICFIISALSLLSTVFGWAYTSGRTIVFGTIFTGLFGMITISLLYIGFVWIEQQQISVSTKLYPGNEIDPVIDEKWKTLIPTDALKVFFGTNLAWASKMPHTVLAVGQENLIQIDRNDKSEIIVKTLKLFDDRDNIIARIDDTDGFWVENSTRRKRPDKSTLIVYDHFDREALRIKYLNQKSIIVTGVFRFPGMGTICTIDSNNMTMRGITLSHNLMGEAGGADIMIGR